MSKIESDTATLAFRCVDLVDPADVDELAAMVERARQITFETFARHVDWKPVARAMQYATEPNEPGLRLSADRVAGFYSSTWRGEPVYYMVQSAIEFVFRRQDPILAINPPQIWGGRERGNTAAVAPSPSASQRTRRPRM